ncbi:RNA polymerase III C11 subunit [Xanthoria parietina]
MLLFCPVCANMLTVSRTAADVDNGVVGQNRMECRTCPYQYLITDRLFERTVMKRKEVDDVMGGKDAWANADRTGVQCPREGCDGAEAFFYQVQIRSADEPMTTFYRVSHLIHCFRA